jgi:hypothetical protein
MCSLGIVPCEEKFMIPEKMSNEIGFSGQTLEILEKKLLKLGDYVELPV